MKHRIFAAIGLLAACTKAPTPPPADPEVISLSGALNQAQIMADAPGEVIAQLQIRASDVQSERNPLNVCLVLDTSGSMEGEPIESLREATKSMLSLFSPGDHLCVVAFHSEAEVLLESTEVSPELIAELEPILDAMQARGTTALAAGLANGIAQIHRNRSEHTVDRIVLLGDGVPNSNQAVVTQAQNAKAHRVAISALGLGVEYDPVLMGQIAQVSGGHFEYLDSNERVATIFQEEVVRLEQIVARNLRLQLNPGPGVELLGIVGQDMPQGDGGIALTLGDLAATETRNLYVRLRTPARRVDARVEVLDARLDFQDAVVGAGSLRRSHYLGARATQDREALEASQNLSVQQAADEAQAAANTIEAIGMVRLGRVAEATRLLDRAEELTSTASTQGRSIRRLQTAIESAPAAAEEEMLDAHDESMDSLSY